MKRMKLKAIDVKSFTTGVDLKDLKGGATWTNPYTCTQETLDPLDC